MEGGGVGSMKSVRGEVRKKREEEGKGEEKGEKRDKLFHVIIFLL